MEKEHNEILSRLKKIEIEVEFIKESMPTKDMFLDSEERVLLEESYKNERDGSLVSSKKARELLGV